MTMIYVNEMKCMEVIIYKWNELHESDSVHVLLKVFLLWMSVDFCEK